MDQQFIEAFRAKCKELKDASTAKVLNSDPLIGSQVALLRGGVWSAADTLLRFVEEYEKGGE